MTNESGIVDYDDDVTVVTVATDAPDNFEPPPAMIRQEKQGGRCCGVCCDYRRAVIILGIISTFTGILDFLMAKDTVYTMDDDELVQELEDLLEEYRIPNLVLDVLFIIFGIIAVVGGVRFSAKVVRTIFVFLALYCFRFLLPYSSFILHPSYIIISTTVCFSRLALLWLTISFPYLWPSPSRFWVRTTLLRLSKSIIITPWMKNGIFKAPTSSIASGPSSRYFGCIHPSHSSSRSEEAS
jgi:hypothetical protein